MKMLVLIRMVGALIVVTDKVVVMIVVVVIAPKASAEGACILGEMGFCY